MDNKVTKGDRAEQNTYLLTYLPTYLLFTPCSRALLEKLTGPQLVKKFPILYGTRKFITAFTSAYLMYVIDLTPGYLVFEERTFIRTRTWVLCVFVANFSSVASH